MRLTPHTALRRCRPAGDNLLPSMPHFISRTVSRSGSQPCAQRSTLGGSIRRHLMSRSTQRRYSGAVLIASAVTAVGLLRAGDAAATRPPNAPRLVVEAGDRVARVLCLGSTPGGRWLVAGYSDGFVAYWEFKTGRLVRCL